MGGKGNINVDIDHQTAGCMYNNPDLDPLVSAYTVTMYSNIVHNNIVTIAIVITTSIH